jgi:hypothetical protein
VRKVRKLRKEDKLKGKAIQCITLQWSARQDREREKSDEVLL